MSAKRPLVPLVHDVYQGNSKGKRAITVLTTDPTYDG